MQIEKQIGTKLRKHKGSSVAGTQVIVIETRTEDAGTQVIVIETTTENAGTQVIDIETTTEDAVKIVIL